MTVVHSSFLPEVCSSRPPAQHDHNCIVNNVVARLWQRRVMCAITFFKAIESLAMRTKRTFNVSNCYCLSYCGLVLGCGHWLVLGDLEALEDQVVLLDPSLLGVLVVHGGLRGRRTETSLWWQIYCTAVACYRKNDKSDVVEWWRQDNLWQRPEVCNTLNHIHSGEGWVPLYPCKCV